MTIPAHLSGLTCARCDKPLPKAPRSLPQGQATCHPCRRAIKAEVAETARLRATERAAQRQAVRAAVEARGRARTASTRTCSKCRTSFVPRTYGQRFCTQACWFAHLGVAAPPKRRTPQVKTKPAHYKGRYHVLSRKVRDAANANPETRCWRCGKTMDEIRRTKPRAQWTAGHIIAGDPTSPLAPECGPCNYAHGARLGTTRRVARQRARGSVATRLTW